MIAVASSEIDARNGDRLAPVLRMASISKAFPGVIALKDVLKMDEARYNCSAKTRRIIKFRTDKTVALMFDSVILLM